MTTRQKNKTKKKNSKTPTLRFDGFNGAWREEILETLAVSGFSNGVFNDPKKVGSGYRIINVKDMYVGNSINVSMLTLLDLNKKTFERNKAGLGDIFFTRSSLVASGIAYSNILTEDTNDITFDGHLIKMIPDQKKVVPKFLALILRTHKTRRQIVSRGKTATMTTIGQDDLKTVKIIFPSKDEQEKIAGFLSAVDEWLENLKEQKCSYESYKKGLMQKLFPSKGQSAPSLRLSGFSGDWEEKKLGEVCDKKSSNISASSLKDNGGAYIIYGATGELQKVDFYTEAEKYISIIKDGAGVGRLLLCKENTSVLGTLDIIKPKRNIDLYFLYTLINKINFKKYIIGSTIPHIYFKDYKKEKIKLPSLAEQEKIAMFLSSIDDIIEKTETKITQAEQWKKGLMQRLFV